MTNDKLQKNTENKKVIKTLSGVVVSDKMKDTVVVKVSRFIKHKKYQKFYGVDKKYSVHNPGNTVKVGDKVTIIETKPISKTKRFMIKSIA